ncbi:hypothetical protein TVAG_230810 [Trichomonas vaginalis G3]|uniref:Uncharacterized protein n=1 Tax=Trichomonas vaginalis (strain ATCC PRA-98 / G3) TaxID=412133 RepID=A2EE09_TRIV3|nr:amelogenin-related protein family [Trichomonas vaginalis G3]EAY09121.1 hypothetical protein TVAG_230810 [Trichomonas vaginalis G3]KAI5502647.1 amelogenin-related protein family [Trichomonas vaginalis G3]|eukprot:XP_001321344.1 hypothetical protein [Trichomonas vaginalis G3]
MGLNSYSISSSTTCSIPIKTLIVFTQSDSIIGDAIVGSKSLSILGSSGIKAIAFLENGKLKLSSTSGTQTCKFIAYDYSKAEDYCTYVTILSGKVKYTLSPAGSYTYCIVSAFSEVQLKIETDEQNHYSYNVNNLMEYGQTSSDETVTSPVITYAGQYYTYSSTIKFNLSGSSSDESFIIDGSESKYDFYTISSTSSSQMNTGDAVGKASIGGLKPWAIALIVIFVIIAFIVIIVLICVCCCDKRCCCCSSSKVSASKEENNARPAQRESTSNNNNTAYPAQRISQSNNNNSAYPAQMASSSNNNSKARPVQRVEETNSTTIKVNVVNTTYIAPPPSQPPQPQQTQPNYIPPPPQTPVYVAPPHQSVYGVPPQQPVYGVPPQQPVYGAPPPVYGAPPQQPAAYIAPAPAPSYSAPETKDNYYNPYN